MHTQIARIRYSPLYIFPPCNHERSHTDNHNGADALALRVHQKDTHVYTTNHDTNHDTQKTCTTHDLSNLMMASNLMHATWSTTMLPPSICSLTVTSKLKANGTLWLVRQRLPSCDTHVVHLTWCMQRAMQMWKLRYHGNAALPRRPKMRHQQDRWPDVMTNRIPPTRSCVGHGQRGTALAILGCSTTKWMARIWEPFRLMLTPLWGHEHPKS